MGWDFYFLAGLITALVMVQFYVITQLAAVKAHSPLVLDAWKASAKAALSREMAVEAYKISLTNKQKMEAFESWAQALTASTGQNMGDLSEQIEQIVGMGKEDFQQDLDSLGFNSDPNFDPDEMV